ncbi:MAG: prepilin-type N-terminal cleavage/methylation domain-containing protein [Nitrospina sp.]|jgi:general secretion pathway protein I|nr:prepilin-type N-terminal cleavage/methylation domain-containing protein [Nitrospina sp.]MBT6600552.1 prepilin-type N-terminal cleavage/methylation domain-containing protein [Nitrospina sp.]
MLSALTPLPGRQKSKKINNDGFSLLEVIVSLAIMAIGFVTVSQLFSGSIRSVSLSEQYLKGTTLAHSKLGELEINNYPTSEFEGSFLNEKKYRWQLEISPYTSPLNSAENNIQLSRVKLNVLWEDNGKTRDIELNTLKVDGALYPGADFILAQSFGGGPSSIKANEKDDTPPPNDPFQYISGRKQGKAYISGAYTPRISGN